MTYVEYCKFCKETFTGNKQIVAFSKLREHLSKEHKNDIINWVVSNAYPMIEDIYFNLTAQFE